MTDMYDKMKRYDGKLKPYPHNELGVEVSKEDRRVYCLLCVAVYLRSVVGNKRGLFQNHLSLLIIIMTLL